MARPPLAAPHPWSCWHPSPAWTHPLLLCPALRSQLLTPARSLQLLLSHRLLAGRCWGLPLPNSGELRPGTPWVFRAPTRLTL